MYFLVFFFFSTLVPNLLTAIILLSSSTSIFPCRHHSTIASYSYFIPLPPLCIIYQPVAFSNLKNSNNLTQCVKLSLLPLLFPYFLSLRFKLSAPFSSVHPQPITVSDTCASTALHRLALQYFISTSKII